MGKIKTRSYVDKDGVNKYITEILADVLLNLEKKTQVSSSASGNQGVNSVSSVSEPAAGYTANPAVDASGDDFAVDNHPGRRSG